MSPWKVSLGYNIESFDVCKVKQKLRLEVPYGVEDTAYLTYKETWIRVRLVRDESSKTLTVEAKGRSRGSRDGVSANMAVSHCPAGHSLLGGDAYNFWGRVIPE